MKRSRRIQRLVLFLAATLLLVGLLTACTPIHPEAPSDQAPTAAENTTAESASTAAPMTIAVARSQPISSTVTVTGTVTVAAGAFESSTYDKGFALQDADGGIYVSLAEDTGVKLGDLVAATGQLQAPNGLLLLVPTDATAVQALGVGAAVTPEAVKTGAVNEASEGRLVVIEGKVSQAVSDDLPYGYKFYVDDGSGEIQVFVSASLGLDLSQVQLGQTVRVVGFSAEYATTYEVQPRLQDDIAVATAATPITTTAAAVITTTTAAAPVDIAQRYAAALQDAKVAEPSEIVDTLTAITPDNPELTWQDGRVLVVTWTSWKGYDNLVGQETKLGREVWVTAVPQLQSFCQSYVTTPTTPLTLRLEELLGLPANNGKTRFVQMWVTPTDMFRPSPDGEIDDTVAELTMPGPERFPSQQDYEFHRDWFNLQMSLQAYDDPSKGYPWTRLGYTYDWGNPQSEVGLSEFVIAAGSTVGIDQVIPNDGYCVK